MKKSWYARKEIGNYRYPRRHPDVKRDKLNMKGMKKLNRLKPETDAERYLRVGSRAQILIRIILISWKWKLSLISPSAKGGKYEVKRWQFIAEERYGKVRRMVLQSNPARNRVLKRI